MRIWEVPKREATSSEEDFVIESAVLVQLLAAHPVRRTLEEMVCELEAEGAAFGAEDAVRRAVRVLGDAGLVRLHDQLVSPTLAALRGQELLGH